MTEDTIVLNLLDFYKSRGINMDQILDDPLFKSLSLETKLKAIKQYANIISEGTPRGITKKDLSGILSSMIYDGVSTGIAAYGTAAAASKLFSNGKIYGPAVIGVGLAGAIAGAAIPALSTFAKRNERETFHNQLDKTVEDPSDRNAFHTLALKGLQLKQPAAVNPRLVKLIEKAQDFKTNGMEKQVNTQIEEYNEHYLGNKKLT